MTGQFNIQDYRKTAPNKILNTRMAKMYLGCYLLPVTEDGNEAITMYQKYTNWQLCIHVCASCRAFRRRGVPLSPL